MITGEIAPQFGRKGGATQIYHPQKDKNVTILKVVDITP